MRAVATILLFGIACLAGLVTSELLWRSSACREQIARLCGRGELLALVGGAGIYEQDLVAEPERDLEDLIAAENLRRLAREGQKDRAGDALRG